MTKSFIVLAALTTASQPAFAETFTRDGSTYTYTTEQHGKATLITGKIVDTGEPFRFRVSGERITGSINGRWVTFSMRDVAAYKSGAQSTQIAAR